MKAYLNKEKIMQSIIETIGKEEFLFAKLHEGELVYDQDRDSDDYSERVYDTTWIEEFDGLEVEILEDNILKLVSSDAIDLKRFHQPSKDAWIVWK